MFYSCVDLITLSKAAVLHGDVTLQQAHIDLFIGEGTVDDMGVIDHPPHGTPGVVDDLATVQDDMLRGVLGILRVGVLVVVVFTGEP